MVEMTHGLLQRLTVRVSQPCRFRLALERDQLIERHAQRDIFLAFSPSRATPLQCVVVDPPYRAELTRQCVLLLRCRVKSDFHGFESGKEQSLLTAPPLRTVRASFPAHGSSLAKA